jgi:hypothetical protein
MERHVLDHHLDPDEGVYRIVIGAPLRAEVQSTTDEGKPVHDEKTGEPVMETCIVAYDAVEDVVFDAEDERWFKDGARRPHEEVAADQMRLVKDALLKREEKAKAQAARRAKREPLPGAGDTLL